MSDIKLYNDDCIKFMGGVKDKSIDFICTDIPYDEVNRKSQGLRKLDKTNADVCTFDLDEFLIQCYRVCKGSICIFCGMKQFSKIYDFFSQKEGTVRCIVWKKTNPSPMNGQHIYLSGVELCVWFKPKGWKTFNAFCKSNVFEYPCGGSKVHPTQKNLKLITELIENNTNKGDLILDTCMGSGTCGIACANTNRNFIGVELDENYYNIAKKRIEESNTNLFDL